MQNQMDNQINRWKTLADKCFHGSNPKLASTNQVAFVKYKGFQETQNNINQLSELKCLHSCYQGMQKLVIVKQGLCSTQCEN